MNILFINTFNVSPHLGGTERITDTLCTEFQKTYHHNVFWPIIMIFQINISKHNLLKRFI